MKIFTITANSLTIWLLASLINSLLFAIVFSIAAGDANCMLALLPAVPVSMLFSAPGIFCFWLVFCLAVCKGRCGQPLFRLLLLTAVCCSIIPGIAAGLLTQSFSQLPVLLMGCMGAVSAVLSLLAHRGLLMLIRNPSKSSHHV